MPGIAQVRLFAVRRWAKTMLPGARVVPGMLPVALRRFPGMPGIAQVRLLAGWRRAGTIGCGCLGEGVRVALRCNYAVIGKVAKGEVSIRGLWLDNYNTANHGGQIPTAARIQTGDIDRIALVPLLVALSEQRQVVCVGRSERRRSLP
jgi:hypothetical protein